MNRRIQVSFTFLFIVMILGGSVPLLRSSDGISHCATSIILDDSKKIVEHQDHSDSIVRLTGSVSLAIPMSIGSDKVYFSIFINSTPFPSTKVPLMVFDRSRHQHDFNFTLYVPFDTPRSEKYSVSVEGRYGYNLSQMHYTVSPATCIIYVKQYYYLDLDCEDWIKLRAGNSERIRLNTTNRGNGGDRSRIEIVNLEDLDNRGWDVRLDWTPFSIPQNRSKIDTLIISIPSNEKPGEYKIEMILASAQAESLGDDYEMDTETITVQILNNYADEIVTGAIIAGPLIMLFAIIMIIIKVKKRKERGNYE